MAEYRIHFDQAEHNIKSAFFFANHMYYDWSVTMIFYSALHYIEGSFILIGRESTDKYCINQNISPHSERLNRIKKIYCDTKIYGNYSQLYNQSCIARYLKGLPDGMASYSFFTYDIMQANLRIFRNMIKALSSNQIFNKKSEIKQIDSALTGIDEFLSLK